MRNENKRMKGIVIKSFIVIAVVIMLISVTLTGVKI